MRTIKNQRSVCITHSFSHHSTQNHMQKSRGFTLLEMMLVIIIIAAIIGIVASTYKKHTAEAAAEKTAAEMQSLVIAAQRYHDVYDYWPSSISSITGTSSPFQLNACGTMLTGNTSTSCDNYNSYNLGFPNGYSAGSANTATKSGVIYISTVAPNNEMAKLIASKLPAAQVNTTTHEVKTTATALIIPLGNTDTDQSLPDMMKAQKMIMVKSIYTDLIGKDVIRDGKKLKDNMQKNNLLTIQLPICPSGWTPGYDVALDQYQATFDPAIQSTDLVAICKQNYNFSPNEVGESKITITGKGSQNSPYHAGSVLIITYCAPPTLDSASQKNIEARYTGFNESGSGRASSFKAENCYFANFKSVNGY